MFCRYDFKWDGASSGYILRWCNVGPYRITGLSRLFLLGVVKRLLVENCFYGIADGWSNTWIVL